MRFKQISVFKCLNYIQKGKDLIVCMYLNLENGQCNKVCTYFNSSDKGTWHWAGPGGLGLYSLQS